MLFYAGLFITNVAMLILAYVSYQLLGPMDSGITEGLY